MSDYDIYGGGDNASNTFQDILPGFDGFDGAGQPPSAADYAQTAQNRFNQHANDIGQQVIGHALSRQDLKTYGDIIYHTVKHDTNRMGPRNGPSEGWEDGPHKVYSQMAHSDEARAAIAGIIPNVQGRAVTAGVAGYLPRVASGFPDRRSGRWRRP